MRSVSRFTATARTRARRQPLSFDHVRQIGSGTCERGVYIDGFNLYYGGRSLLAQAPPGGGGWTSAHGRTASRTRHTGPVHDHARRLLHGADQRSGQSLGRAGSGCVIKALRGSGNVDHVELGKYIEEVRIAPLATSGPNGRPVVVRSTPPMLIKDAAGQNVSNATFMASVAYREEKAQT